ncbi:MAG TPA: pyridoxal-phosphate dependent enzyme [Solirubrobacteraceae bacterium]|nr:pyridoxal-phosphate dependent enzyme [Solirubrobacteraceae bacterium]
MASLQTAQPPTFEDVQAAAERLAGVAHRTPVITSRTLDEWAGAHVMLKAEGFQRMGAFKFRGAYNAISQLSAPERERGVVTASSGNHAQAVALASSLLGTSATILMPADAPASKRAATEGYGATVLEYDRYRDDRNRLLADLARELGASIVHPYDDPRVMAGAGTVALELAEDAAALDTVVVPLGGGGLLSGSAITLRAVTPTTRIVGVEPEASPDTQRSLVAGRRLEVPIQPSIADGQLLETPGEITFEVVRSLVDEVVTVSDAEIVEAMRALFERAKLVVEPSGASALAAVLAGRVAGDRLGVILSGANISAERFAELLT